MFHGYLNNKVLFFIVLFAVFSLTAGCGTAPRMPVSQLDTPEHHVFTGMKLLDQEKYIDAQREFDLALELDKKYSRACTGLGLVKTYLFDFKSARDYLEKGASYARTDDEILFSRVSMIRYQTQSRMDKNWLEVCKDEFDAAVKLDPKYSAAYYFMGLAYKQAIDFHSAGQMFAKVLELKTDYVSKADSEWNFIQKVQRAMPGSVTGKQIALVTRITRADAAALFMEELKIDVLYKKRTPKKFDTSFKDPEKAAETAKQVKATARDIADHPLRADIEGILEIGVRGLENYPDGNFHPGEIVTRAAYAMMLEDILLRVTGDDSIATRFIGSRSPFSDMNNSLPYFNAVMVVTTRGLMETKDITTGEFAPNKSVAGVDALLTIRMLKDKLNFN
ncbi:MAG: S-layer homology domain-containing protein [Deltaproteobacteria bacterium]